MNMNLSRSLAPAKAADDWFGQRESMIETQLQRRGVTDPAVLAAIRRVPGDEFVPDDQRPFAYNDKPLPIGAGQTISQPYIVACMTAALALKGTERVLEIGTGCGYQAAVLSLLAKNVFTMERNEMLASASSERLARLGYANVQVRCGDGTYGLAEFAPYDAILVAAAAPAVPPPLYEQLADCGRLIVPIGSPEHQELQLFRRKSDSILCTKLEACRFVPLIGYYGVQESSER